MLANPALNPVRFALWTLRDKAAQRRLALRWASLHSPHNMTLKSLLFICAFLVLGACSTASNSEIKTTAPTEHRLRTLNDVHAYIFGIVTLSPDQLNVKSIEAIADTLLQQRGGHFDADFAIDESLSIHMQLAQHDKDNLNFLIEFRPTLPIPKDIDQKGVNDYIERLAKFRPQTIQAHCIAKERIVDTISKDGWVPFETNLSPSPEEEEGNFYFSSEGDRYLTLTINGNCLEQFTISKGKKYPAYSGIPKSKN